MDRSDIGTVPSRSDRHRSPQRLRVACGLALLVLLLSLVTAAPAGATFPGKNGLIAFSAETDEGEQLFTVSRNGRDLRQVTHGPDEASTPDWSPDGGWLAYTLNECTIALVRPDGTGQRAIPSQTPEGCEADPAFTLDGRHLVFERYDATVEESSVWIMDLHGDERRRIGTGPTQAATPEVSPDGRTVTFLSDVEEGLGALFAIGIGGGTARQVTPTLYGIAYKHDWAPDGSRIVTSDNADDPDHPVNVVTIRPDGTGLRYLTHLQSPDQRAYAGGYSPDGRWIVYRLEHGDQNALVVVRADGHGAHTILPFSSFRPRFMDWGPAVR
ncbi:TolB family protein [Geodermatophilus sp. SYSU D01036]